MGGVGGVGLGELEGAGVVFGEMLDVVLTKGGHVVEAVKEVGAEVGVGFHPGDGVAQGAELFEGATG